MKSLWLVPGVLLSVAATAHVNDREMDYGRYKDRYGQSCCDSRDCKPASDFVETVVNGEAVVRLLINGKWVTVAHSYVIADYAWDGRAHFCGRLYVTGGNPIDMKPEPMCVILPPRDT